MGFLLFCLLYACWVMSALSVPPLLLQGFPLAFLLLSPLVHRLGVWANLHGNLLTDGLDGGLDIHFRFTPLGETLCFPPRLRWLCLGFAALLLLQLGAISQTLSHGLVFSDAAIFLVTRLPQWVLLLMPVLYTLLSRGAVSAVGDVVFSGLLLAWGGVYRVLHTLSDPDAILPFLGSVTVPWLFAALGYAVLLALFLRGKGQGSPSPV